MNTMDFTKGTIVYGRDSAPVGEIVEVWAKTETHGCLPVSQYLTEDYGPVKGTRDLLTTTDGYLQVRQGHFLGMGGRNVWVPLAAVDSYEAGSPVTLTVSALDGELDFASAANRFQQAA